MLWSILDEYLFIACLATIVTISFFHVIILWTVTFAEGLEATPDCTGGPSLMILCLIQVCTQS
jgi:hypothetical protein